MVSHTIVIILFFFSLLRYNLHDFMPLSKFPDFSFVCFAILHTAWLRECCGQQCAVCLFKLAVLFYTSYLCAYSGCASAPQVPVLTL